MRFSPSFQLLHSGVVNIDYAVNQLPFVECRGTVIPKCTTDIECVVTVPECQLQQAVYYIGVETNNFEAPYLYVD